MATTIGLGNRSRRPIISCPARAIAVPSSAELIRVNSWISAPATKFSALPDMSTTARASGSSAICRSSASSSSMIGLPSMFTDSPGTSRVRTAIPSAWVSEKAVIRSTGVGSWELGVGVGHYPKPHLPTPRSHGDRASYPLQYHRQPHPALGADRDQPELDIAPLHLVGEGGDQPGTGGSERVANGDRASHDVGAGPVHFAHWGG